MRRAVRTSRRKVAPRALRSSSRREVRVLAPCNRALRGQRPLRRLHCALIRTTARPRGCPDGYAAQALTLSAADALSARGAALENPALRTVACCPMLFQAQRESSGSRPDGSAASSRHPLPRRRLVTRGKPPSIYELSDSDAASLLPALRPLRGRNRPSTRACSTAASFKATGRDGSSRPLSMRWIRPTETPTALASRSCDHPNCSRA